MSKAKSTSRLGRRNLLAGTAALIGAPGIARAQGRAGVALVIGNSKYNWESSLPNVKRDAPDVAKRLQEFGLKVDLVQDAGRDAMRQAIDRLSAASRGAQMAAFYYAGHGASWNRGTYLVPVDADLSSPNMVERLVPGGAFRDGFAEAARKAVEAAK